LLPGQARGMRKWAAVLIVFLLAALGAGAWWYLTQRGPGEAPAFEEMVRRALVAHSAEPGSAPPPRSLSASLALRVEAAKDAPKELQALSGNELRAALDATLAPQAARADLKLAAGARELELSYRADAGGAFVGHGGQWRALETPTGLAQLTGPDGPLGLLQGGEEDARERLSELLGALARIGIGAGPGRLEAERWWVYPLTLNPELAAQQIDVARASVKRNALARALSELSGEIVFDPEDDRLEEISLRLDLGAEALRSLAAAGGSKPVEGLARIVFEAEITPAEATVGSLRRPARQRLTGPGRFSESLGFALLDLLGGISEVDRAPAEQAKRAKQPGKERAASGGQRRRQPEK